MRRPRLRANARRGFTLIELLIVTLIISILAVVLLSNIKHAIRKAKEGRTYANLAGIRTGVNIFYTMKGSSYSYQPAGSNKTGGFPYSLREGGWFTPSANGANWAGGDDEGFTIEKGAYSVNFNNYVGRIAEAEVALDGNWTWADGSGMASNGIWQSNLIRSTNPTDTPTGNYRGWNYNNTAGLIVINNNSPSTEGKRYDLY